MFIYIYIYIYVYIYKNMNKWMNKYKYKSVRYNCATSLKSSKSWKVNLCRVKSSNPESEPVSHPARPGPDEFISHSNIKNKLTDLCGNWLLQNNFIITFCEIRMFASFQNSSSEERTTCQVLRTSNWKQRPESGRDCLMCAVFALDLPARDEMNGRVLPEQLWGVACLLNTPEHLVRGSGFRG